MAKFEKRLEARELRRKGRSINFIAEKLGVSKSSASVWCRDLKLTKVQSERLMKNAIKAGHKGRMMGAEMNRRKKEEAIALYRQSAKKEIGKLSKRDFLIAGIALYWGEGSKNNKFTFVNSDPEMILFMFKWLQEIMKVKKEEFMPRIFINEMHKPRAGKVLRFWSSLLKIPEKQFGNIIFLKMKQKKVYENYDSYFGVLALGARNSANLKYKVLGFIEALKKQMPT
ncbi:MAG: hypothetical protein GXP44_03395 [bacterium]|nr:hypothetical protein [bacterium]